MSGSISSRAIFGGELTGDRLVRIVYLDESGTSRKADEPFIVVAGVIVHGDHQLNKLRLALTALMEKHIPEVDRETLVLHACDIYGGNGYFDKRRKPEWDWPRRAALLADIARIPRELNLWVCWGFVPKDDFPYEVISKEEGPHAFNTLAVASAYIACLVDVDQWFASNARQENCFIVVENNNETRQFIRTVHSRHQDPAIRIGLTDRAAELFPLRHVHEDPNFQEKRVGHPLVLADFIAYFMKRRLMKDARSFQFSGLWNDRLSVLGT